MRQGVTFLVTSFWDLKPPFNLAFSSQRTYLWRASRSTTADSRIYLPYLHLHSRETPLWKSTVKPCPLSWVVWLVCRQKCGWSIVWPSQQTEVTWYCLPTNTSSPNTSQSESVWVGWARRGSWVCTISAFQRFPQPTHLCSHSLRRDTL